MPDLPDLLAAIRTDPAAEEGWLALAGWLADHGRDDEAVIMRVFWPAARDTVGAGTPLHQVLRMMARDNGGLARRARAVEAWDAEPSD
jgi:uncharacterized protein (TIGR02996 family)